jgi:outer membrane protein OmpA-like peptidoglycan-associated protein
MRRSAVVRASFLCGLALLAVAPLDAQDRGGQFEFGAFGAYTSYDNAFNLEKTLGAGARFGYFIHRNIGVEAEILFQSERDIAGSSSSFEPIIGGGSLLLNLPLGGHGTLFALGGYSRLDFATVAPYEFTDGGIHGGAGVRLSFSEHVALRVEGRLIFTPETESAFATSARHLMLTAGFSVFHREAKKREPEPAPAPPPALPASPAPPVIPIAAAPVGDGDGDGVGDQTDRCPATAAGAAVDLVGCPTDQDGDGVWDGLDQCFDTARGARVNPAGCPTDGDVDGVYDGLDQCPDTPPGVAVDATGCSSDADRDTVLDGVDQCPLTPYGAVVDGRGCPRDGDGDGVFDGLDECPTTPAGASVDARGCQTEVVSVVKDSDGDGVTDDADRCPGTPAGSPVDRSGCVILFREETGTPATPLVLQGVNFTTGRSTITADSYGTLDAVAASLVANPAVRIEIAGHTDNTGSKAINLRLSQARAAAVRAYLARKGVSPARMVARGYGEAHPVDANETPDGRAKNRRVELRRIN